MSTYQELRGLKVKYLAANPDPGTEGDVWYDSATYELKGFVARAAWSSGAPMIAGVGAAAGNSGIQTAAFYAGGTPGVVTQEYNGSGWSLGGNINTTRYRLSGAGTQTAGLVFGGQNPGNTAMQTATEEYDGSSWTSNPNGLGTGRAPVGSTGTQTAGLAFGGRTAFSPPYGDTAATEEYNGSAWTAGGNMPAVKIGQSGAGLQTAALAIGGQPTPTTTTTYEYDGSSWSEGGALNTGRYFSGAAGTQTAGLTFGGSPGGTATEDYDGSTWTTSPATLGTARETGAIGPMGTNTAALLAGSPGASVLTEEFNRSFEVVTQGAWSSGATLNTGRNRAAGAGTQTAAMMAGGFTSPPNTQRAEVEEYNGTAWSEVTNIPSARSFMGYGGTQTAAVAFGGTTPVFAATLEYDGTNWTAGGDLGTARYRIGGAGTQTAALGFGGYVGSPPLAGTVNTEEYDGSSWTDGGNLGGLRSFLLSGSGVQTDAMCINGGLPLSDTTEIYNGSTWTAGSDTLFGARSYVASAGTSTNALRLFTGGVASPSPRHSAESATWDGSAFSTAPSLATSRKAVSPAVAATSTTAMAYGGDTHTSNENLTEEFTAGSTAETGSTIDFD